MQPWFSMRPVAEWLGEGFELHIDGWGGEETYAQSHTVDGINPKQPPGMYKTL